MNNIYIPSVLKSVKEQMTSLEFINTESVRSYLQRQMNKVTNNIPVEIVFDSENFTNGKEIHVNPYPAAEYTDNRFDALLMLTGVAFHETLHVIYTDFSVCHKYYFGGYINGEKVLYADNDYYLYRRLLSDICEDAAITFYGNREFSGTLTKGMDYANRLYFERRPSLTDMYKNGATPFALLMSALEVFGVMDEELAFPDETDSELDEIKEIYRECLPLVKAARVAQKTSDRCKVADDLFNVMRDVIERLMAREEKCPVFDPVQPSVHKFVKGFQNFESYRKSHMGTFVLERDIDELTDEAVKDEYDRHIDERYFSELSESIDKLGHGGLGPLHNTIELQYIQADQKQFARYRESYNHRVIRLTSKIKLLLKGLLSVIQKEQDDTIGKLYAGNRYTQPFRADKKCCSYRNALSDPADLFIYVMVDSSGSMGMISDYVKDALTMFYEVCRRMNIPITIVAHNTSGNIVTLRTLVDANLRRGDDQGPGIESFEASGGTRDGVALMCAAEYLRFREESRQLVIAISDGEPWHNCKLDITPGLMHTAKILRLRPENAEAFFSDYANYSSADIKHIIWNRNIHPIGVALAPTLDQANALHRKLRNLYPESFSSDIDHLQKKLAKVLEKYLFD